MINPLPDFLEIKLYLLETWVVRAQLMKTIDANVSMPKKGTRDGNGIVLDKIALEVQVLGEGHDIAGLGIYNNHILIKQRLAHEH